MLEFIQSTKSSSITMPLPQFGQAIVLLGSIVVTGISHFLQFHLDIVWSKQGFNMKLSIVIQRWKLEHVQNPQNFIRLLNRSWPELT
jgi:hypothetical protein